MQIENWNDLTYILAIKRGRSYSKAAKILNVDETTVSRRLAALQMKLNTQLFIRLPSGSLQMTESGEAILCHIDSIENTVGLIEESLDTAKTECKGTVRITSVPIVVNRILAPRVRYLFDDNPELDIVLIPDSKDLSLSYREADLAIRLARPKLGGTYVKARRIGHLSYSVYTAKSVSSRKAERLPWVSYDDSLAQIPPAEWTNLVISSDISAKSHLKVHDAETALQATLSGSFKSLLPDAVVADETGLRRLSLKSEKPPPSRDLWLLGHADQSKMRRIIAVSIWIENTLNELADRTDSK